MGAVTAVAAEPTREEALLCLALTGELTPKERSQRGVAFDAIVEAIDERIDRCSTTDAGEELAAHEGAMRFWMSQKSTVLHAPPIMVHDAPQRQCERSRGGRHGPLVSEAMELPQTS